jgi:hypothetical protein
MMEKRKIMEAQVFRDKLKQAAQVLARRAEAYLVLKLVDEARSVCLALRPPRRARSAGPARIRLQANAHDNFPTGADLLPPLSMRFSSDYR